MKVGFIGLGNIGAKQPRSLLRNAVYLKVYDLNDDLVSELNVRVLRESSIGYECLRSSDNLPL